MRHQKKRYRLAKPADQRKALLRSLTTELLRYGKILVTEARAKAVRSHCDRMITLGKRGDLHARRQAEAWVFDTLVCRKLFSELAQTYRERNGGYTRVVKTAPRRGDGAPMAVLMLS
ncbi:MAG: 50S ribosomal protein L17 [Cyanobacteria bacterium NC_groundwater_1444_Ag_S-0.65um_54_12]|nr:50S ribosomal protein L17 [Cyanobacteria bacterium NC_groundwater_1444_Ag_S-0.65um_54_12]